MLGGIFRLPSLSQSDKDDTANSKDSCTGQHKWAEYRILTIREHHEHDEYDCNGNHAIAVRPITARRLRPKTVDCMLGTQKRRCTCCRTNNPVALRLGDAGRAQSPATMNANRAGVRVGMGRAFHDVQCRRPKLSDPARGTRGLQPERDGRVRCSAFRQRRRHLTSQVCL